jgi:hypothetical protein
MQDPVHPQNLQSLMIRELVSLFSEDYPYSKYLRIEVRKRMGVDSPNSFSDFLKNASDFHAADPGDNPRSKWRGEFRKRMEGLKKRLGADEWIQILHNHSWYFKNNINRISDDIEFSILFQICRENPDCLRSFPKWEQFVLELPSRECCTRALLHIGKRELAQADEILLSGELTTEMADWVLASKAQLIRNTLASVLPDGVDQDQAMIIADPSKTIKVTARAGSGKTRLLKAITYFLIKEYGYAPDEILLLAFNLDAAEQLEQGLIELLGLSAFPSARTFHSLSYGIAQPKEAIVSDNGRKIGAKQLTRLVQDILHDQLDDVLREQIYSIFRYETETDKLTGALLRDDAHYDFRRELDQVTLKGYPVKSTGEKYIGDFLFEHGIEHFYEDPIDWKKGDFFFPLNR